MTPQQPRQAPRWIPPHCRLIGRQLNTAASSIPPPSLTPTSAPAAAA